MENTKYILIHNENKSEIVHVDHIGIFNMIFMTGNVLK